MKHRFTLLTFALFTLLFFQCKEKTDNQVIIAQQFEEETALVQITGFINNRDIYPNTKELTLEIPSISSDYVKMVIPIDDDDTFHFQIQLNQPQDIRLKPYLDFLYVVPGDSLHIELDFADLTKVRFSGTENAAINNEYYKFFDQTSIRDERNYSLGTAIEMSSSLIEIRKLLDEKKALNYEKRDAFLKKTNPDENVRFLTESMIELDYYSELIRIMALRKHSGKEIINLSNLMGEIRRNAERYYSKGLYSNAHFNFIGTYILLENLIHPNVDKDVFISHIQETANDTIRNFIFASSASYALKVKDLETFEKFSSEVNNDYLNSRLMKEYQIAWEKMNNPEQISAAITGERIDNELTASMLQKENIVSEIISKNKGKVQVITIWATWCGPCISEFSHFKTLIEKYKDKDVSFSFICAAGDKSQNYKILQRFGLENEDNRICTEDEFTFLTKTFSPLGFPYGILINKKGVIVDYGTHVRPQTIQKKIEILLEQDKLIKAK